MIRTTCSYSGDLDIDSVIDRSRVCAHSHIPAQIFHI